MCNKKEQARCPVCDLPLTKPGIPTHIGEGDLFITTNHGDWEITTSLIDVDNPIELLFDELRKRHKEIEEEKNKPVMCEIPIEVITQARVSLDALLYWAEENEDIPKEIYDEADKVLNELEKYVPFPNPIKNTLKILENTSYA